MAAENDNAENEVDDFDNDRDDNDHDRGDDDVDRDEGPSFTDTETADSSDFDDSLDKDTEAIDIEEAGVYREYANEEEDKEKSAWDKFKDTLEKISNGIKGEVERQKEDIKSQWAETKNTLANTVVGQEVNRQKEDIQNQWNEFTDTVKNSPLGKTYTATKDALKKGTETVLNKIEEGYDWVESKFDQLNEYLGNPNTAAPEGEEDAWMNPYKTTGVIDWHARNNPSMYGDWTLKTTNLGPKDLSAMTRSTWDRITPEDQQRIIKEYGMPKIFETREDLNNFKEKDIDATLDNPYLTQAGEIPEGSFDDILKYQSMMAPQYAKMGTEEFENYISQPTFGLETFVENMKKVKGDDYVPTTSDWLTAVNGELAMRGKLGGSLFGDNQAKKYNEAHPDALSYDDLRALKSVLEQKAKYEEGGPGDNAWDKYRNAVGNFFMPGGKAAIKQIDFANANFDPAAVIEAAKENNMSVKDLLKMRSDILSTGNPVKAIQYFEMTGDTLGNQRAEDYAGAIIMAVQGVVDGTMDENTAALLVKHYKDVAEQNKASDIWNNPTMRAIRTGAVQEVVGAVAGFGLSKALQKGAEAVLPKIVARVSDGKGTKVEQAIMRKVLENSVKLENEANRAMANNMYDELSRELFGTPGEGALEKMARELNNNKKAVVEKLVQTNQAQQLLRNADDPVETARHLANAIENHIPVNIAPDAVDTVITEAVEAANREIFGGSRVISKGGVITESAREALSPSRREEVKARENGPDQYSTANRVESATNPIRNAITGANLATGAEAVAQVAEQAEENKKAKEAEAKVDVPEGTTEEEAKEVAKQELEKEVANFTYDDLARQPEPTFEDGGALQEEEVLTEAEKALEEKSQSIVRDLLSIGSAAMINPLALMVQLARLGPRILTALGFTPDEITALDKWSEKYERGESEYDSNDYQNEVTDMFGKSSGEAVNYGEKYNKEGADDQNVTSDEHSKVFIRDLYRSQPHIRKLVSKWV